MGKPKGRVMSELALRIKEARVSRGLSQFDLARLAGTNQPTVDRIERGQTRHSKYLDGLLKALQIEDDLIPVLGTINERGAVSVFEVDAKGALGNEPNIEFVSAPAGVVNGAALRVIGLSMWPRFGDGDVVIYERTPQSLDELLNRTCVVFATDGRVWLKTLEAGSARGLYNLTSHNAPPMRDVSVDRAYRVAWVRPAT